MVLKKSIQFALKSMILLAFKDLMEFFKLIKYSKWRALLAYQNFDFSDCYNFQILHTILIEFGAYCMV